MSVTALIERAAGLVALLDGRDAGVLSDDEVLAGLDAVGEIRRRVDAVGVHLAAQVDARSERADDGSLARRLAYRTPAALVAERADLDGAEATAWISIGAAVRPAANLLGVPLPAKRESLAAALASGDIAVGAARTIAATLDAVEGLADAERIAGIERILVEAAGRMTRRDLGVLCRSVPDRLDVDGAPLREQRLRELAGVRVVRRENGLTRWIIDADPESAGILMTALDARTAPRRRVRFAEETTQDDVTADIPHLGRRRLDALVGIARESLCHDQGRVAGAPVTMLVTVGIEELRSGLGIARIAGVDEPISAATARRLASDAQIIPQELGGPSEILDQGRAQRLATPAQRVALAHRDGGCAWPGCEAPPGWCEVAHILAWILGGPTDLSNLMLLCPFHHRRFDLDDWQVRWEHGIPWFIPPPHVDATRRPRRGGPIPLAA